VIMALNPKTLAAVGAPASLSGSRLYGQVCAACHGAEGAMVAEHKLSAVVARQGRAATIAYIKNPKAPMPKLYPDLLTDQSIIDVTDYLYQQWGHHD